MSNIWSLFEDYEKRYHGWLKDSAVPATTEWYKGTGLDTQFQNIQTGLLGEQRWDPSGTKRVGGSLETAGGVVKDYFQRKDVRQMHPTEGVQVGPTIAGSAPFQKDVATVGKKTFEVLGDITKVSVDLVNKQFDIMFPNANKNISNKDKKNAITNSPEYTDAILRKQGLTQQDGFSLSKWAGVNMDDIKKEWKDKGGFDGLMSNPAFTLGLAFNALLKKGFLISIPSRTVSIFSI